MLQNFMYYMKNGKVKALTVRRTAKVCRSRVPICCQHHIITSSVRHDETLSYHTIGTRECKSVTVSLSCRSKCLTLTPRQFCFDTKVFAPRQRLHMSNWTTRVARAIHVREMSAHRRPALYTKPYGCSSRGVRSETLCSRCSRKLGRT